MQWLFKQFGLRAFQSDNPNKRIREVEKSEVPFLSTSDRTKSTVKHNIDEISNG